MIGNDGIYCKGINGQSFKVQNTANGQKIYAKGLGTTGESGQLIKKVGAYKEFANKLADFMHRYIKETSKQAGFSNALDNLISALPDDTFITSV